MKLTILVAGLVSLATFTIADPCTDYQIADQDVNAYCDDGGECCFAVGGCNEAGIIYSRGSCPNGEVCQTVLNNRMW
ncbi:hypothetical protein N7499_003447 [Penicillium canescens]|uniref:Uncharacterized protein n=1 Tax=Penicillium canescens TaxID=5083 RepID=A0AAD6N812_PENCN|nr:uncharacterized protein N7446_012373 [Penicillium canescens]KAJ6020155.1 hypothetical protein N7522_000230 [Penicillium canescens]KAJ6038102.1 hypothetical protein N7460_007873 [Penicillium canescens]KAJ6045509.1 hypothetical protein N7446_012373 [Penicillium canescens]KAJ6061193.1 hypothetical protein N7444_001889 [Penicillium canescens]KAJ6090733.1 hypothetical protein N7499_003447 [Penicillium canescens]